MRAPLVTFLCLVLVLGPGCPSGRDGGSTAGGASKGATRTATAPNSPAGGRPAGDAGAPGAGRAATGGGAAVDRRWGIDARRLAPIGAGEAKSTHGPYASGACETCHERHDAADPGRAVSASNEVCVGCHEEFAPGGPVRLDRSIHPVNDAPCIGCHNPHNARKPKLQM